MLEFGVEEGMAPVAMNHRRILLWESRNPEASAEPAINLSDDTVFEFLGGELYDSSSDSRDGADDGIGVDLEDENAEEVRGAEADDFWQSQLQLLQSTICRTTSLESRIRKITNEAVEEAQESENACGCFSSSPGNGVCRKCLMENVCLRLRKSGFDSAICKSQWRSSLEIPSGQHTFLDVVDNTNPKKGQVRIVIEFDFQAEFEMARATEDYKKLTRSLPATFVGKIERLLGVLKIMSAAAKRCMKEKKMHMGPWRKHRYMQAKWLRASDRSNQTKPLASGLAVPPLARPRMSMLTLDLTESLATNLHRRAAVRVV